MPILDYAYRKASVSSLGGSSTAPGATGDFEPGCIAREIIDFCTHASCGLSQVKYGSNKDYCVTATRLPVGDNIAGVTLTWDRLASQTSVFPAMVNSVTNYAPSASVALAVGDYLEVTSSSVPSVVSVGVKDVKTVRLSNADAVSLTKFSLAADTPSGAIGGTIAVTTAVERKVFALKRGPCTFVFSIPTNETLFGTSPRNMMMSCKVLSNVYNPGASTAAATLYPSETASLTSVADPALTPCDSVGNFLNRAKFLHCFKCKDMFYFFLEKTDGSYTCFTFGRIEKRGSWVGGETADFQWFDPCYMNKPAGGFHHKSLFQMATQHIRAFDYDATSSSSSLKNSAGVYELHKFKTPKIRCRYPAARFGAKEVYSGSPPVAASYAMFGVYGVGTGISESTKNCHWFASGLPVESNAAKGYILGLSSGFSQIEGHTSPAADAGVAFQAIPTGDDSLGMRNNLGYGAASVTEFPSPTTLSRTSLSDVNTAAAVRFQLHAIKGMAACSPNGWNNRVPGVPFEFFIKEYRLDEAPNVARLLDLGVLPGLRAANCYGYEAQEIANSDWMVFPMTKLSNAQEYDHQSFPPCYGLGYLVKKGVTLA